MYSIIFQYSNCRAVGIRNYPELLQNCCKMALDATQTGEKGKVVPVLN
jgi:hypothetical protein